MSSKVPLAYFEPSAYDSVRGTWLSKNAVTDTEGKNKEPKQISDVSSLLDTIPRKKGMEKLKIKSSKLGGIKPLKSDFIVTPFVHKTNFYNSIKGHTVAFTSAGLAKKSVFPSIKQENHTNHNRNGIDIPLTPMSLDIMPSRALTATSVSSYRYPSTAGSVYKATIGNDVSTGTNVRVQQRRKSALDKLFSDDVVDSMHEDEKQSMFEKQIQIDFSSYMHNKSLGRSTMTSSSIGSLSDMSSSWNNNTRYGVEINSRQSNATTTDSDMTFPILTQPLTLTTAPLIVPPKGIPRDVEKGSSHRMDKKSKADTSQKELRERMLMSREEWHGVIYDNVNCMSGNSWRTIKIFVSSTFNDMHGERDAINKVVIPDLNDLLRSQRIKVMAIDLRWGLTREDTSESGLGALEHCLHEIDGARPFFIALMGERYGWIPKKYRVTAQKKFDWIKSHKQGSSITEMEMYHGFLNYPHRPIHAFVYRRDPDFIRSIKNKSERAVFEFDYPGNDKVKSMRDNLSIRAQKHPYCMYREYKCKYGGKDRYARPYVSGLQKTFTSLVVKDLYEAIQFHFPKTQEKRNQGGVQNDSISTIDQMTAELELSGHIHKKFVDYRALIMIQRPEYLKQMKDFLKLFWDFDASKPVAIKPKGEATNNVLLLNGDPGCGKTSLVCSFISTCEKMSQKIIIISYIVGGGPNSNDEESMLRTIGEKLITLFGLSRVLHFKYRNVLQWFLTVLTSAGQKALLEGKLILVVIDGIDQLDSLLQKNSLGWIPKNQVQGCTFIVSFTINSVNLAEAEKYPTIVVEGMTPDQQAKMAKNVLSSAHKKLSDEQCKLILQKQHASNPLYLQIVCEELILGGQYGLDGTALDRMITNFPNTLENLLLWVLNRLEQDMNNHCYEISLLSLPNSNLSGSKIVERAMCLLACSRHGLEERALQRLIHPSWEFGNSLPDILWIRLYRSIAVYLQPKGFQKGTSRFKFFRRELIPVIKAKYFYECQKLHRIHQDICRYLTAKQSNELAQVQKNTKGERKIERYYIVPFGKECIEDILDIVYHQIHSIDIKGLRFTLGSLKFLEKCFVTAATSKNEVIIAAILQFYRTAYHIICSALPTMREELLRKANTNLHDIKWWFQQMWWFLVTQLPKITRSPLLLYQFASNYIADSAPEKMSRLKSCERSFIRDNWLWIARRGNRNAHNTRDLKLFVNYSLPILLLRSNEVIFASEDRLRSCHVNVSNSIKLSDAHAGNTYFFKAEHLPDDPDRKINSMKLSDDKNIIVTKSCDGNLSIWTTSHKTYLFCTQDIEPNFQSSEFTIVGSSSWNTKASIKQFEYIIVSLCKKRENIAFWKVKFTDNFAVECKSAGNRKLNNDSNNEINLLKKFSIRSKYKLLCMQKLRITNKVYVVLTPRGTASPILYSVEYVDKIPVIFSTENTGNSSIIMHDEISRVLGVFKSCDSILSMASFGDKDIYAFGTLYGKLHIWNMEEGAHNSHSDTVEDCYNEETKSTQPAISRNLGGSIILLAWHASSSPNKALLICPILQKGIVIWEYFLENKELIKLSTINNNDMQNFSQKFSICDQYILTAFNDDNGHKCLHTWDLDNIEMNSLNTEISLLNVSSSRPESGAGRAGSVNLISNSTERIIGCSISGDGMYAGTVYSNGKIQVWNTISTQLLDSIECINADRIAFSMYGEYLIVCTSDSTLYLWELAGSYKKHGKLGTLAGNVKITVISFIEELKKMSVGDNAGSIYLFDLEAKRKINVKQKLVQNGMSTKLMLDAWTHKSGIKDLYFINKTRIQNKAMLMTTMETPEDKHSSINSEQPLEKSSQENTRIIDDNSMSNNFVLASLSIDGTIKLWSLTTYKLLFSQKEESEKAYMNRFMDKAMRKSLLLPRVFGHLFFEQINSNSFEALVAIANITNDDAMLEEKLQWYKLKPVPMTGLTNGAHVTCVNVGFSETYVTIGFDDGTVDIYSLESHKHVSSFVCNSAVSDICLPQLSSFGHFLVRDMSGQIYQLFINIAKVPERSVSIKVSQAFRNVKTLLKFRKKESVNDAQMKNSSIQNNMQFKVYKQEYTRTLDTGNSRMTTKEGGQGIRLITCVPFSWSPSMKVFSQFFESFLQTKSDHEKDGTELTKFMNVCGHTSTTIPALIDRVRILLDEGLVTSRFDRFCIFCDGKADNKLNQILGEAVQKARTVQKSSNQVGNSVGRKVPNLVAIVPLEGISLEDPVRRLVDCEERVSKSFGVVSNLEKSIAKFIHVTGSRQWNSRLAVLRKICENFKLRDKNNVSGICIVIGGDRKALDNINLMMRLNVPIIIVVGSGGIADAIYGYRVKSRSHFFGWKSLQNRLSKENSWLSPIEDGSTHNNVIKSNDLFLARCANYKKLHLHDINDSPKQLTTTIERLVEMPLYKMQRAIRRLSSIRRV